jgi:potassium/sodium efflux P-type ATPase
MGRSTEASLEAVPGEPIHALPVLEVYGVLATQPQGLTQAQVEERLRRFGRNAIREIKGKPLWLRFLANFTHLMALLLWAGGVVGFIAHMPQLGVAIWMVNIINGVFSFWQEFKAEKATEALRRLLSPTARVLRDGEERRIPAAEVVPGDLLLLAEGDRIAADARLVEAAELRADQSTLTGESQPVRKTSEAVLRNDLTRTEMPNLVFAGTTVAAGTGKAVVIATGMETEFGKVADLTQSLGEDLSPLQKEMGKVVKIVTVMATGIGLFFFLLAVLLAGAKLADSFVFSMGMIVAFVPEGMLPTVTLALAIATQRMAKRNALIKRLSAAETMGCTTVICTDKTGTLTQNEMTVRELWVGGRRLTVTGVGYAPEGQLLENGQPVSNPATSGLSSILVAAGLCNNARLLPPNGESARWTILGDPTEAALQVVAAKAGIDLTAEAQNKPRLRELPFESRRKRMSTIHQVRTPRGGATNPESASVQRVAYIKGAPKEVLELCTCVQLSGREQPLSSDVSAQIMAANDEYARAGLRVLAIAQRDLTTFPPAPARQPGQAQRGEASDSEYTPEVIERDLTFLGLMAMLDPPRPEVAQAVEKCHTAGIRIIMITGDYGLTAESIARRIGIIHGEHPRVITGADLDSMDNEALQDALRDEVLFARVAPEHKLRVVTALQELGHVAAVTGDGVNDAPALKKADIGVAMGIAGTDVAKEAADMILTDDNFASIVNAIEEGRTVYDNIKKFAVYVFTSNVSEAWPFILQIMFHIPLPLTVMQVLAIDLGTDMVPALALGTEAPEPGVMERLPRSRTERLLNGRLLARFLFWVGQWEALFAIVGYFFLWWTFGYRDLLNLPRMDLLPYAERILVPAGSIYVLATTMCHAGIVMGQIGAAYACRTERTSVFKIGFFSNKFLLVGIAVEVTLILTLIYVPPFQQFFEHGPLPPQYWLFILAFAPLIFLLEEARKAVVRWRERSIAARVDVSSAR